MMAPGVFAAVNARSSSDTTSVVKAAVCASARFAGARCSVQAKSAKTAPPVTTAPATTAQPETTAKPETVTVPSVPEQCLETAELADEVISRLNRNIRDERLFLALRDYTVASQACRREASP